MQKCRVNVTDERLHVFHRVGGDLNSDIIIGQENYEDFVIKNLT